MNVAVLIVNAPYKARTMTPTRIAELSFYFFANFGAFVNAKNIVISPSTLTLSSTLTLILNFLTLISSDCVFCAAPHRYCNCLWSS